ncbi:hypothetical protein SLS53_007738 [Cytospora paraplurivora]|uniref:Plasma membrane channel protein n=1 Tax=Cytospora paraplurivora TaxID=2898453 RepID=A0AAN9YC93_9PEZI
MASVRSVYSSDNTERPEFKTNFDVDYVIHYEVPPDEAAKAEASFVQLIEALASVGLATEVRRGDDTSLLIFLKIASEDLLKQQVYRYRVQDWLYGVRASAPNKDVALYFENEPVVEAEKLRLVYLLITKPKSEGGAGVTPKIGQWKFVKSVFPLHNHTFNKHFIKQLSTKYFIEENDINEIRDKFGEKIAFYFAFMQSYFAFLLFPAAFGFGAWLVLGQFSWFYAIVNSLWSVIFFEYWKKKEVDLAVQWGVRGVSRIQHPRSEFQFERVVQDPVTGEHVKVYPPLKRLQRQLLQLPFAIVCLLVLGSLIIFCFAIEIFLSEVYNGPLKQYLVFLPTVILTVFMPALTTVLTNFAEKLTDLENYETQDSHKAAFVQKMFVINFIVSYLPIFLTAFVYVPFGKLLVPYLDVFHVTAQHFAKDGKIEIKAFEVNPDRLKKQIIYFTVTAQVVNFLLESIVPLVKRTVFKAVKEAKSEVRHGNTRSLHNDPVEESAFLDRVRNEAELDVYDVTVDYREMVVQFAIVFLFNRDPYGPDGLPSNVKGWALLLSVLFAEHLYLLVQIVIRYVISHLDSPGVQQERAERFAARKLLLQETLSDSLVDSVAGSNLTGPEKITRNALEEEARQASISSSRQATPEQLFWQRQRGAAEAIQIGRGLIAQTAQAIKTKDQ